MPRTAESAASMLTVVAEPLFPQTSPMAYGTRTSSVSGEAMMTPPAASAPSWTMRRSEKSRFIDVLPIARASRFARCSAKSRLCASMSRVSAVPRMPRMTTQTMTSASVNPARRRGRDEKSRIILSSFSRRPCREPYRNWDSYEPSRAIPSIGCRSGHQFAER